MAQAAGDLHALRPPREPASVPTPSAARLTPLWQRGAGGICPPRPAHIHAGACRLAAYAAALLIAAPLSLHARLAQAQAQATAAPVAASAPAFDADLARRLGADAMGMRHYVLVILETGPTPLPAGPARDAMFRGHFANIQRMAAAGQLAVAGPFEAGGTPTNPRWRGLYVFAVDSVDAARKLTETDPVIVQGEMVARYHPWYGSAALMGVNEVHGRIATQQP